MRAICIASGKGGTSKTTLTAALGAWLARTDGTKVAIADLNFDQATLTNWWGKRGRPVFPHLLQITDFAGDVAALRKTKWHYCLIDTPPDEMDVIETAILEADATLIPVRPSELDIAACRAIVDLCRRRRKPFAFILAQVDTRPTFKKINDARPPRSARWGRSAGRVPDAQGLRRLGRGCRTEGQDRPRNRQVARADDRRHLEGSREDWRQ